MHQKEMNRDPSQEDTPAQVHVSEPFFRSTLKDNSTGYSSSDPAVSSNLLRLYSLYSILRVAVSYTVADVIRRPRNFCIGVFAVILLVFFSGALLMGIEKAPYIFLRLAELTVGEADIMIMGGGNRISGLVNYTSVESRLMATREIRGVAPRWVTPATAHYHEDVFHKRYSTARSRRITPAEASVNLLIIDSEQERHIGLGRGWKHRDTGYAEAHVYKGVLDYLKLQSNHGERINIRLPLQEFLRSILKNTTFVVDLEKLKEGNNTYTDTILKFLALNNIKDGDTIDLTKMLNMNLAMNVVDEITSADGKYPSLYGNIVVIDYKKLISIFVDQSCLLGPTSLTPGEGFLLPSIIDVLAASKILSEIDLINAVPILAIVLKDRRSMYYKGKEERAKAMVMRTNAIIRNSMGVDFEGFVEYPIMRVMGDFDGNQAVLTSSLTTIVFGVIILCMILFFMLLRTNADERQFEFALMRAQGMGKSQVMAVILSQTVAFVIPGIIVGVILLILLNIGLEAVLANFTAADPRYDMIIVMPVLIAIGLGITLPLSASWGAVSHALGSSLRDALDVFRRGQSETKVVMIRLEELGVATWQIILGIFLVASGFIVYYMIPFAFIFEHLTLFFFLMNSILIVMVVGICFIMYVVEPYAESAVLWLMMWGREKQFMIIVKKNLYDHRIRNSKTFMMILISVASIVSGSVMFSMLSVTSSQLLQLYNGADISATSNDFYMPLNEKLLTALLEKWQGEYVQEWAYHSFPLDAYPHIGYPTKLETTIRKGNAMPIIAVSKNLLNTVFKDYILEEARDKRYPFTKTVDGKYDVVASMYDHPPQPSHTAGQTIATGLTDWMQTPNISQKASYVIPAIVAAGLQNGVGVSVGDGMVLEYKYKVADDSVETRFYVSLRALMNRVSGFPSISSVPFLSRSSSVLIPQSFFITLLNPVMMDFGKEANVKLPPTAVTELRQQTLFIRLYKNITAAQRSAFVNELISNMDLTHHTVFDTQESIDELNVIGNFIMYFFYFTAIVCISLCTLMMCITFVANVQMNVQVVGVLRALGCSHQHVFRIILYEAFSIVLSAFFIGLLAGSFVGVTLGLQLATVMVLPFQFTMPYVLIGLLFVLALLAAVFGSLVPFRAVNKSSIGVLMKRT
ncbi:putative permease-like protein [Trypanosoma theileri]|uniref:Putative permease-like protein n=1 Tax=Trypanosoma theileri TaxID=67003 RepID=A0A1X0NYN7_9TRYP|nr:putative permease-like protein [Trypanosoma theileri]ORC89270.1 putative permease-like protein [Trypanosoma theileri]